MHTRRAVKIASHKSVLIPFRCQFHAVDQVVHFLNARQIIIIISCRIVSFFAVSKFSHALQNELKIATYAPQADKFIVMHPCVSFLLTLTLYEIGHFTVFSYSDWWTFTKPGELIDADKGSNPLARRFVHSLTTEHSESANCQGQNLTGNISRDR